MFSFSLSLSFWQRNHGKHDSRGPPAIVKHRLGCHAHRRAYAQIVAGVRIAVELREVAAGDIHADAMPRQKYVGRAGEVDIEIIASPRLLQFRLVQPPPEP